MSDIIDLNANRNRREQPDPELMTRDEYGRPLYTFVLTYEAGGRTYGTQLIAYDFADAEMKVAGMRESLRVDGKLFSVIPA